jgi:type II secretion system protein C
MRAALLLLSALATPPSDLTVVGVVTSPRPERSVAILRSGDRTRVAAVGETAFGGRLAQVTAVAVILEFEGRPVELRLPVGPAAPPAPPAVASRTEPPEDPATPARTLPRADVERRLGQETPRILAETTLVPVSEGGRIAGFALTRVPEGSLLTDAGLRAGDVLVSVNDVAIDSLPTLIGLWPRLQNERELRAVVLRNGQPISLAVTLR